MASVQMVNSPRYTGPIRLPEGGLSFSPIAQRIQQVGLELIEADALVPAAEEGVFTNSRIPAQNLGHRLLKARDDHRPLVEVVTLPTDDTLEVIMALFGSGERLVHAIRRSEGREVHDKLFGGRRLPFDQLGVALPYIDTAESDRPCRRVISANISGYEMGNYGKHKTRPGFGWSLSESRIQESNTGLWRINNGAARTNALLTGAREDVMQ